MITKAIQIDFLLAGYQNPNTGRPLVNGYVKALAAGTANLKAVYLDREKASEAANPFALDTCGRAKVYAEGLYDLKFYDDDPAGDGVLVDQLYGLKFRAYSPRTVQKTSQYNVTADDDFLLVDASTGPVTLNLASAALFETSLIIKKIDVSANTVTVQCYGTETIDGSNQLALTTQNEAAHIFADPSGPAWYANKVQLAQQSENANTVDGLHASSSPIAGQLLALSGSADYPNSVIPNAALTDGTRPITGAINIKSGSKFNGAVGIEGGEFLLEKPVSGTTLAADITVDIYANLIRFFENGGSGRGCYVDISGCGGSVTTDLRNSDMVDNYHAATLLARANHTGTQAPATVFPQGVGSGLGADTLDSYHAGNSSGQVAVSNGTVCTNLNAEKVGGLRLVQKISGSVALAGGDSTAIAIIAGGAHRRHVPSVYCPSYVVAQYQWDAGVGFGAFCIVQRENGGLADYLRISNGAGNATATFYYRVEVWE